MALGELRKTRHQIVDILNNEYGINAYGYDVNDLEAPYVLVLPAYRYLRRAREASSLGWSIPVGYQFVVVAARGTDLASYDVMDDMIESIVIMCANNGLDIQEINAPGVLSINKGEIWLATSIDVEAEANIRDSVDDPKFKIIKKEGD